MRSKVFIFSAIFLLSIASFGCGGAAPNANTTANGNSNTPATTNTADQTTNAAPTLTPVFKAYCAAMVKKDEAAVRNLYSSDTIKYFESMMKEDKIKTLLEYLEGDIVTGNICEVSNEVITGDKAVAKIRADGYPNGIDIEFVKENGEWKLTNKSPAIDAVKATDSNSAAANTLPTNTAANKK